jgi:hypothetical protein
MQQPELTEAVIIVKKVEPASWDAPDGKKVDYVNITDEQNTTYSVWNPRLIPSFIEGKQVTVRFSKKGKTPKIEGVVGLDLGGFKGKGKGGGFRDRDYQAEHLGRLQNTILVAKVGVWDAEAEKNFTAAWQAYQKIANQYKPVSQEANITDKPTPKTEVKPTQQFRQTSPPIVEPAKPEKAERKSPPVGASSFVPRNEGDLIGASRHYFGKELPAIREALGGEVPTTPEELRLAWVSLCKAWSTT